MDSFEDDAISSPLLRRLTDKEAEAGRGGSDDSLIAALGGEAAGVAVAVLDSAAAALEGCSATTGATLFSPLIGLLTCFFLFASECIVASSATQVCWNPSGAHSSHTNTAGVLSHRSQGMDMAVVGG